MGRRGGCRPRRRSPRREPVALEQAGVPAFMRNYDMRWALGGEPAAARRRETGGWIRTREPRALDAPLVAAMTDAWAPAAFAALGALRRARRRSTSRSTSAARSRRPGMAPEDFVLGRFSSRAVASRGVWEEDGELWTPGRRADRAVAPARARAGAAGVTRDGLPRARLERRRPAREPAGRGRRAARATASRVLASSSTYDTEPVGEVLDQPDFLNACVRIETGARARGAARRVQGGRARARPRAAGGVRHGPRPIDVDLLLLGDGDPPLGAARRSRTSR